MNLLLFYINEFILLPIEHLHIKFGHIRLNFEFDNGSLNIRRILDGDSN